MCERVSDFIRVLIFTIAIADDKNHGIIGPGSYLFGVIHPQPFCHVVRVHVVHITAATAVEELSHSFIEVLHYLGSFVSVIRFQAEMCGNPPKKRSVRE